MKQKILFLFFSIIITSSFNAQEVDYVISNPSDDEKKAFKKPRAIDSTKTANPDYTSYLLNASSFTLKKGGLRLSGTDALFMKGSIGITDNTMASVNISLFGTFTLSVKQKINLTDNLKLGIAASGGRLLFITFDSTTYFGGGQVMVTLGDHQNNITAGTGFYYLKDGKDDYLANNVYVAFQKQLGKKTYLMAEGIYFTYSKIITGALGMKIVFGDRIGLNFGLMPFGWINPTNNQVVAEKIVIPVISFRILLGKNR